MRREYADRLDPVGRSENLRVMHTELLRTADELIESLAALMTRARLLVEENHRLRREHKTISANSCLGSGQPVGAVASLDDCAGGIRVPATVRPC